MNTRQRNQSFGPTSLLEWVGYALIVLTGVVLPLFILPNSFLEVYKFDTDRSEYALMKYMLLIFLSCLLLIAGSIGILTNLWDRYRSRAALPAALLLGFVAWSGLSVAASPTALNSLYLWLPVGMPAAAALVGVMFVSNEKRGRWFLIAMVGCGVVVALIGVVSTMGVESIYRWIFGADPREVIAAGIQGKTQGGTSRAASMSTLANPEYAGGFTAIISAIVAVMIFDWVPRMKKRWLWRIILIGVLGILLLELVFTGSRQPWVALAFAGLLRLMLRIKVPLRALAGGFCAVLLCGLFISLPVAGMVAVVLVLAGFGFAFWKGSLFEAIRTADIFNRWMVLATPVVVAILLVAFSTPGPWNPTGLRILQRFSTISSVRDQSVLERNLMWMSASQMAWSHPIFGVGPGRYTNQLFPALAELVKNDQSGVLGLAREDFSNKIADQSHNDYLQIAAEMGLPALVFFLSAMLAILQQLWKIHQESESIYWKNTSMAMMICLVTFFGIMLTSFPLQMGGRGAFFWMSVATALGLIASWDRENSFAEDPGA